MKIKSESAAETKKLGSQLGAGLIKEKNNGDTFIFSLEGPLGSGKTTFVKGLAAKLGVKKKVKSPSFVLVKKYKGDRPEFRHLFHIDCYRLSGANPAVSQIGFKEILNTPDSVVVVEWGEKLEAFLPKSHYKIEFDYSESKKGVREIKAPSLFFSQQ